MCRIFQIRFNVKERCSIYENIINIISQINIGKYWNYCGMINIQTGNEENLKLSQMTYVNWHFPKKIAGKFISIQKQLVFP